MRSRLRPLRYVAGCVALLLSSAGPLSAQDGATLYKGLCASCHDGGLERAPDRDALRAMSPERVLTALESGAMLSMASSRTGVERRAIAEFVTGKSFAQALSTTPSPQAMCRATEGDFADPLAGPRWNGWGVNTANTRYQDGQMAGFTAADVPRLQLKWAFGFPGELSVRLAAHGCRRPRFVGTQSGTVYALSAATGCVHWVFQADVGRACRGQPSAASRPASGPRYAAFIGDRAAQRVRRRCGNRRATVEDEGGRFPVRPGHRLAGVSQRPALCGHRLRRRDGRRRRRLRVLPLPRQPGRAGRGDGTADLEDVHDPEEPRPTTKNRIGTQLWGPSGAPIWTSPAIDVQRNAVYVTTGNNYSDPATDNSDAFVAFDHGLRQDPVVAPDDSRPTPGTRPAACPTRSTAPRRDGPDFDFASPPILVTLANGRRALVAGQKSGVVHALDPDREGRDPVAGARRQGRHQRRRAVGLGRRSVQRLRGAVRHRPHPGAEQPGDDARSGSRRRHVRAASRQRSARLAHAAAAACRTRSAAVPRSRRRSARCRAWCSPDRSTGTCAPTPPPTGAIVWDFDTVGTYETVNGVPARGGSLNVAGPAISGGMLFVNSGYVQNGMPGNVLLAFSVDGK